MAPEYISGTSHWNISRALRRCVAQSMIEAEADIIIVGKCAGDHVRATYICHEALNIATVPADLCP